MHDAAFFIGAISPRTREARKVNSRRQSATYQTKRLSHVASFASFLSGARGKTRTRRSTSFPSTPRPRAVVAGALCRHEPVRHHGPCPRRVHPACRARRYPARGPRRPDRVARRTREADRRGSPCSLLREDRAGRQVGRSSGVRADQRLCLSASAADVRHVARHRASPLHGMDRGRPVASAAPGVLDELGARGEVDWTSTTSTRPPFAPKRRCRWARLLVSPGRSPWS